VFSSLGYVFLPPAVPQILSFMNEISSLVHDKLVEMLLVVHIKLERLKLARLFSAGCLPVAVGTISVNHERFICLMIIFFSSLYSFSLFSYKKGLMICCSKIRNLWCLF
jgi:hypothetical protein